MFVEVQTYSVFTSLLCTLVSYKCYVLISVPIDHPLVKALLYYSYLLVGAWDPQCMLENFEGPTCCCSCLCASRLFISVSHLTLLEFSFCIGRQIHFYLAGSSFRLKFSAQFDSPKNVAHFPIPDLFYIFLFYIFIFFQNKALDVIQGTSPVHAS